MIILFTFELNKITYNFEHIPSGWRINGIEYPKDTGVCFDKTWCADRSKQKIHASFVQFWEYLENETFNLSAVSQQALDLENKIKQENNFRGATKI
ncbi:hypothetical protein SDC9_104365 [bioreactor metagenome]|uniref:Uncharacterized protein n=1 Tax=bioreactor metagenome TaxID=1076179 RepID=A0A645B307_9ZZZZ|nr:hypothetical protein [Cloacibacillus evryensis]MEA5034221.1 hypothetical protein [Cloacibacillus evryensis]